MNTTYKHVIDNTSGHEDLYAILPVICWESPSRPLINDPGAVTTPCKINSLGRIQSIKLPVQEGGQPDSLTLGMGGTINCTKQCFKIGRDVNHKLNVS